MVICKSLHLRLRRRFPIFFLERNAPHAVLRRFPLQKDHLCAYAGMVIIKFIIPITQLVLMTIIIAKKLVYIAIYLLTCAVFNRILVVW